MNWLLLVYLSTGQIFVERFPNRASCNQALAWFGRHGVKVVNSDNAVCYQDFK